jgi:Na+/H+ antiporter NhaA
MPKAVRIVSTPIAASSASSEKSDYHQLATVALFCGIGLLMSLVAVLMGVQGAWY